MSVCVPLTTVDISNWFIDNAWNSWMLEWVNMLWHRNACWCKASWVNIFHYVYVYILLSSDFPVLEFIFTFCIHMLSYLVLLTCCIYIVDDIGDHLCERVLSVLFTIWLLACHKCFPSPSLWKTFRNMCVNWRHHEALITQWHKVNHALTHHLLKYMNGPDFPELHLSK